MTYVVIDLRRSGKCFKHYLLTQIFVFALQALSSPAPKSFLHAGTSSEVMHSGSSLLLSPFLQKGGIEVGGLGMPLCCFPRVFLSSRSTLAQREGWRSLWSLVRCMRAHLSPWFIRGLGIQELLSCGGLLLPVLSRLVLPPHLCTPGEVMGRESLRGLSQFSVASPASSLHARRGGEAGEASECRSS